MFVCGNCGKELNTKIIIEHVPFTKKGLLSAVEEEDYEGLYRVDEEYVLVSCSCGNPKLSDKDEALLKSQFVIVMEIEK